MLAFFTNLCNYQCAYITTKLVSDDIAEEICFFSLWSDLVLKDLFVVVILILVPKDQAVFSLIIIVNSIGDSLIHNTSMDSLIPILEGKQALLLLFKCNTSNV